MEKFEIKAAKKENENVYAFLKVLIIISLAIIFFGLITYLDLTIIVNRIYINWSIYSFAWLMIIYITLTILELKEGAINGN